jgi:hypothetical protein
MILLTATRSGRLFAFAFLLIVGSLLAACKKEEPAPVVGNLRVSTTNYNQIRSLNLPYQLYTEASWASLRSSSPLRSGPSADNMTILDLNPGNYVFTLGGASPMSAQVTAGRTNTLVYRY